MQAPAAGAAAPQLDLSALQSLMTSLGQQPPPPPPSKAGPAQQPYPQGGAGVMQAPGQHCMTLQEFKMECFALAQGSRWCRVSTA